MAPRGPSGKIAFNFQNGDRSEAPSALGTGRNGQRLKRLKAKRESPALSRPALRRLARRAGVKRINDGIYEEAPTALLAWLRKVVNDTVVFAENARRMTVIVNDVLYALKRNGVTLYGFDLIEKRRRLVRPLQRQHLAAAAERVTSRTTSRSAPRARSPAEIPAAVPHAEAAAQLQFTVPRPRTRPEAPSATPAVVPERAQDIQVALAAYRDSYLALRSRSSANVNTILEWINGHMAGRNKAVCLPGELDVVLEALEEQEAVMVTDDDSTHERVVYFVA